MGIEHEVSGSLLLYLAVTLGMGLLVGLERERANKEIGLRTFSFTALLGFLSWHLGQGFSMATLAFVAVVVVIINVRALQKGTGIEATTSVSLFLVAFVGMFVAQGHLFIGIAVTIMMLMLLSWKKEMVLFSRHLQRNELHAAITLGLLSFVILPVLPTGPIDPWGLFDARKVWLMVVAISAIGFGNYILLKLYGTKSITYTGFLGGLVNSTATFIELSRKVRDGEPGAEDFAFRGMMWAKTAAFLRNGVILALFAPSALPAGILPVVCMLAVTMVFALKGTKQRNDAAPPEIALESPFSMRSALQFGMIFAAITVVSSLAERVAGNLGFYAVSFAGGLVSSSSTAATAANLVATGNIEPVVAGSAVVLANIASALVVLPLVLKGSGSPVLVRRVGTAVAWVVVAIGVGIALNPIFLNQYTVLVSVLAPQ